MTIHSILTVMENQLFHQVPTLGILICHQCKHGVRPTEVEQHLKKKHYLKYIVAIQITQAISQWHDIQHDSSAIQIPQALDEPLPILPCHTDGLLCLQGLTQCNYVATTIKSMRKHWQVVHQWSQQSHRGRVSQKDKARGKAELQQSF
jgi:hypothetical protein